MGQIFRRISKIAKSYINDSNINYNQAKINDKDEELKRIIDELNKEKYTKEEKHNYRSQKINQDGLTLEDAYKIIGVNPKSSIEEIKSAYRKKFRNIILTE